MRAKMDSHYLATDLQKEILAAQIAVWNDSGNAEKGEQERGNGEEES